MANRFSVEERMIQDIKLLTARDDFDAEIKSLRKKHQPYFNSIEPIEDEFGDVVYIECDENLRDFFDEDIKSFCNRYKLSILYTPYIQSFIESGKLVSHDKFLDLLYLNPGASIETVDCVNLQIFPETTLQEIIDSWPRIKYVLNKKPTAYPNRRNRIENLDRDLYTLNLKRKGFSAKEIASKTNKKYKNTVLSYSDIPIIIQRLKNRANRLITSKKS